MRLDVKFHQSDQRININFAETTDRFALGFGEIQRVTYLEVEKYDGDYEVTPKISEQTLATKDKFMSDDVTVKAIPYAEVTNKSGGKTATIGGN